MNWRSLGDSNPCFRRERATLASFRSPLELAVATAVLKSIMARTQIDPVTYMKPKCPSGNILNLVNRL
jgi:hypothetical protein